MSITRVPLCTIEFLHNYRRCRLPLLPAFRLALTRGHGLRCKRPTFRGTLLDRSSRNEERPNIDRQGGAEQRPARILLLETASLKCAQSAFYTIAHQQGCVNWAQGLRSSCTSFSTASVSFPLASSSSSCSVAVLMCGIRGTMLWGSV